MNEAFNKKVEAVMREYQKGKLKTSSGKKVTNRKQAIAIAMSEAEKKKTTKTVTSIRG